MHRHCVRMPDGALLNRYWDDRDTPREESYLEDVLTASTNSRPVHQTYHELRAGAASGWDFSSRWCGDGGALASIRTTSILPVDLNSFMHKLESQIAQLCEVCGDADGAEEFRGRNRRDGDAAVRRDREPRAGGHVADVIRARLIEPGGLATSVTFSAERWDQPNGWAPLHWMAVQGLMQCGEGPLGHDLSERWLKTVGNLYEREGKLVEKYELRPSDGEAMGGGGGEYPLQDGFGWTNGITQKLLEDEPMPARHARGRSRAPDTAP